MAAVHPTTAEERYLSRRLDEEGAHDEEGGDGEEGRTPKQEPEQRV